LNEIEIWTISKKSISNNSPNIKQKLLIQQKKKKKLN